MEQMFCCSRNAGQVIGSYPVSQLTDLLVSWYCSMEGDRVDAISQTTEGFQGPQMQQPKTVTFCCNILQSRGLNIGTKGTPGTESDDCYFNVKMKRNRLRSAQRAYEQKTYSRLRGLVPTLRSMHKKSSRLDTLKHTCAYIEYLKETMEKLQAIKRERESAQKANEAEESSGEMLVDEAKKSGDKE